MKKFKNEFGIAVIAVVLIVIAVIGVGGAAALGIRMAITGDDFLQPFDDLGWIDLDKDDDSKDEKKSSKKKNNSDDEDEEDEEEKSSKKNSKDDEDDDDDDDEKDSKKSYSSSKTNLDESKLSSKAKKSDVTHYFATVDLKSIPEFDGAEEYAEMLGTDGVEFHVFTTEDECVEVVLVMDMNNYIEKYYKQYESTFTSQGYTKEDFKKQIGSSLETSLASTGASNDMSMYYNDGYIQMHMTKFDNLLESFNLDKYDEDDFIEELENKTKTTFKVID